MTGAIGTSFYILIFIFLGTVSGGMAVTLISKVFYKNSFVIEIIATEGSIFCDDKFRLGKK
jgi:zinc transporter, ZIP family